MRWTTDIPISNHKIHDLAGSTICPRSPVIHALEQKRQASPGVDTIASAPLLFDDSARIPDGHQTSTTAGASPDGWRSHV